MPGAKVGCMGTPLRAVPSYASPALTKRPGGWPCAPTAPPSSACPGEIGMMLSRVEPECRLRHAHIGAIRSGRRLGDDRRTCSTTAMKTATSGSPGSAHSLVTTAHGVVGGSAVEDALGILDAIDVSVTYAVPGADGDIAVTAVTLRAGRLLDADDLSTALGQLAARPATAFRARRRAHPDQHVASTAAKRVRRRRPTRVRPRGLHAGSALGRVPDNNQLAPARESTMSQAHDYDYLIVGSWLRGQRLGVAPGRERLSGLLFWSPDVASKIRTSPSGSRSCAGRSLRPSWA